MIQDWEQEARTLQETNTLGQEHIVQFITAFRRCGAHYMYLMFEWADGGNLRNFWKTYPRPMPASPTSTPVRDSLTQIWMLAQALEAAHYPSGDRRRFRHGDLKPENILWFRDNTGEGGGMGKFKIGDWGLAKGHDLETELRSNRTSTPYGTRHYESPEEKTGTDVLATGGK